MSLSLNIPATINSPAEFFIFAYSMLGTLAPEVRSAASKQTNSFKTEVKEVLLEDDEEEIVHSLRRLAGRSSSDVQGFFGRILAIMTEIDSAFYCIHPRAFGTTGPSMSFAPPPIWLRNLRTRRRFEGTYATYDRKILIPRGPLLRESRQSDAASADSMADRFSALGVTQFTFLQEERSIQVKINVVGAAAIGGVSSSKNPGAETVSFIPVAEDINDLEKKERTNEGCHFVSFSPASSFSPVRIAVSALVASGPVDIAIMPESVMPASHIPMLSDEIGKLGVQAPRLIICGSGDTDDKNALGMAWNEASVLNSIGSVIWRQRKIWPAGFSNDRAVQYGIEPAVGSLVMEDNASAELIEVVDIDSLGRCIILICQDVLAAPVSSELIGRFQPDWIFTPILDSGIGENRWINDRVYEFSGLSQSRYVVSCSMSLAVKLGYPSAGCGLAMGPRSASNPDKAKQYTIVKAANGFAVATWRANGWSTK